jgi:DNA-directed RNA polymerase specialized sigma24 family protein
MTNIGPAGFSAGDDDARALLAAARAGARRAIRGADPADVEDAAATAVLRIVGRGSRILTVQRPAAYAAACGRTTAIDAARAHVSRAKLAHELATVIAFDDPASGSVELPFGWTPQEALLQADSVRIHLKTAVARAPSAELQAVTQALDQFLAGRCGPSPSTDTTRRCLDRGIARLARLVAAASAND